MADWIRCTTTDGTELLLNADHVAIVRPYHSDRGFSGSEIVFATGAPSSITVKEGQDQLTRAPAGRR